jgi:hypothetical protein
MDDKYGRITVEREPGNPIGDDEPLFVLRARDQAAVDTIKQYAEICRGLGCDEDHVAAVEYQAQRFEEWAGANPDLIKKPD